MPLTFHAYSPSQLVESGKETCYVYGTLASSFASEKLVVAQPHIKKATDDLTEIWMVNMQPHVDEKVMPVYNEKIAPHVDVVKSMAGDAYTSALPQWLETKAALIQVKE